LGVGLAFVVTKALKDVYQKGLYVSGEITFLQYYF